MLFENGKNNNVEKLYSKSNKLTKLLAISIEIHGSSV